MALTEPQRAQIQKQLAEHQHKAYRVDIALSGTATLAKFSVHPGVMRPEKMTSLTLARYLWESPGLYKGKDALDLGCGSGIQGVVMARNGARTVHFSDVSLPAVLNTIDNVDVYCPMGVASIHRGDLFEGMHALRVDLIVFNHPFFPGSPEGLPPVATAMLDEGDLLRTFLKQAKHHLTEAGKIIMPFFQLAGTRNHPALRAVENGYRAKERLCVMQEEGLQQGEVSVYEIWPVEK